MTTDRDEMARIIMMSCATKMKPETATHYADNLIRAGYGKAPSMTAEPTAPGHECEPWQMLELDEGQGTYCSACGKDAPVAPEKSAAEIWDEALAAAEHALAGATQHGGAYGQQQRKVSGWTSAAQFVAKIPNPYANTGIPARESEEWKALCQTAENLGTAVAAFQNAKDDYTTIYPKDKQ